MLHLRVHAELNFDQSPFIFIVVKDTVSQLHGTNKLGHVFWQNKNGTTAHDVIIVPTIIL